MTCQGPRGTTLHHNYSEITDQCVRTNFSTFQTRAAKMSVEAVCVLEGKVKGTIKFKQVSSSSDCAKC